MLSRPESNSKCTHSLLRSSHEVIFCKRKPPPFGLFIMNSLGIIDEESKDRTADASASVVSDNSGTSNGLFSVSVDPKILRLATVGEEEAAETGERTKILCCGSCCDARKACIIIDTIYFSFVIFALIMTINDWNPLQSLQPTGVVDDDDDVAQEPQMFDPSQILKAATWQICIGIVMSAVGLVGAIKFQPYLVLVMAIWLCIDAILFCIWLNFISAVCVGLYSYPHFALFNLLRKGKLTRENYEETERYCCCTNDGDGYDDDDDDS